MIAIDLGSNSFRCIDFDCTSLTITDEYEAIVKTAHNITLTGRISDESINNILNALSEADAKLSFSDKKVVAVTTEAIRRASNAADVLERLYQHSGIHFHIIDAKREAELTTVAVESRIKQLGLGAKNFTLFDLGGGSLEIMFKYPGMFVTKSFNVGIVTCANNCSTSAEIDAYLAEEFKKISAFIQESNVLYGKTDVLISTAGTPTTMAAFLNNMTYKSYDATKINGYVLSEQNIDTALDGLIALSESERAEIVGVGREDLIISGIHIVKKIYKVLGFESSIVIDDGLREGLAITSCKDD